MSAPRPETPATTAANCLAEADLNTPTRHQRGDASQQKYAEPYRMPTQQQPDTSAGYNKMATGSSLWRTPSRDHNDTIQRLGAVPRSSTPALGTQLRHEIKTWPPPPLLPQDYEDDDDQGGSQLPGRRSHDGSSASSGRGSNMGNEDEVVIQSSPRAPDFSKKLMSSPGGQHGPATSFFEDLTSYGAGHDGRQPSAYPMAPSASAPVGVSNAWRPQSGSFSSTSSDASSFQSAVSESAQLLQAQVMNQHAENVRLTKRCEELTEENKQLREALQRLEAEYSMSSSSTSLSPWGHLSSSSGMQPSPSPFADKRHLTAGLAPTSPHLQRFKQQNDYANSRTTSPNLDGISIDLLDQIRLQAQAGFNGSAAHEHASSPHVFNNSAAGMAHWPPSPTQHLLHARQQQAAYAQQTREHSLPLDLASYPYGRVAYDQRGIPSQLARARSHSPGLPYLNASGLPTSAHPANNAPTSPASLMPETLVAKALTGRTQEASIALQQQLKAGSYEVQQSIIRAIEPHILALCEDKHGNFLVQRAIAVDTSCAWKLKGHFARLTNSQYGCHVVHRVLDAGEDLQRQIVEELLCSDVYSTFTGRYCVHVWAKILEIRWTDANFARTVFETINAAMRGRWAGLAMQETGSIIVQNLFESAIDRDKAACIAEVLERLPDCAANQWGVWVVQHLIEHGSAEVRQRAYERLCSDAARLSLSNYGHKAIMTALKGKDPHFLMGYLNKLVEGQEEGAQNPTSSESVVGGGGYGYEKTRRSMLVEVASSPHGLQIVTQLLTTVGREERERIIKAVRKNSVFLKGNKSGLKIHQLCERARAFSGY